MSGALAGCAVGPDYHLPTISMPSMFLAQSGEKILQSTPSVSADLTQWWRALHDTELDSLIARALEANLDLEIALERLQAARTLVTQLPPSTLLSAQSIIRSESTKPALSALRTDPTYLAHVQKKANKKHQAGPHYASLEHLFSSLRDGWYRAVGL